MELTHLLQIIYACWHKTLRVMNCTVCITHNALYFIHNTNYIIFDALYITHNTLYITSGYHGIHPAGMHGPGGILSFIAPRKTFTRNRRQAKRETRLWEKEERRRRTEVEEKKKKKSADYFRALLAHREEFVRFHKNKRIGKTMLCLLTRSLHTDHHILRHLHAHSATHSHINRIIASCPSSEGVDRER